jgi:predicted AlkP superfamily phosphohydrolase/phosphomutase
MGKIVVAGLDGVSIELIRDWAKAGKLPTLARLLNNGASGTLRSTIHPYTAQAWTTMVTGVNAGRHRLFDFWERQLGAYSFRLTNASDRAAPALWTVLGQSGHRVLVVNVPMTYPPEPVNGVLVSGRDTPGLGSSFTHPPQVKEELRALSDPYVIVPDDWRWVRQEKPKRARDELLREIDIRFETVQHLTQTRDWDFCMFVVGATDGASHFFWHLHDPASPTHNPELYAGLGDVLLEVYQHVDRRLGELLATLGDDVSLAIVSDHGSGGRQPRAIHLNLWLAERGWLTFQKSGHTEDRLGRLTAGAIARMKEFAYSLLPYQQLNRLRRMWPDRWRRRLDSYALFADLDWAHTRAFSEERRGNIWINLHGRDPQGIVAPSAEYEGLRDEIITALEGETDPEAGTRIVHKVWRREELFDGPYLEHIPDLLVEVESPAQFTLHTAPHSGPPFRPLTNQERAALTVTGDHRMDGTIILQGPVIRAGATIGRANMEDIFPTLMYMANEPIPAYVEGHVLEEAFLPEQLIKHPPHSKVWQEAPFESTQYSYSEEEAREVEERLAGLGYLG